MEDARDFVRGSAKCGVQGCATIDFLPFTCDGCQGRFCVDHRRCEQHSCSRPVSVDRVKLSCPLCLQLVPCAPAADPNAAVDLHISRGCPVEGGAAASGAFARGGAVCALAGCKESRGGAAAVAVPCSRCHKTFCLKHRLERDHNCSALAAAATTAASAKAEDDWLKSFGSNSPKFKNAPNTAAGDAKIPEADRFLLAVNFPQALQRPPLYAFVSGKWSAGKVVDALCTIGKVPNQNNEAGCEKKLRLFTLKGRRLDNMQVIGSTPDLPSGSTVILEYGEVLPTIDKKKVAVGKKVSKDDCCVC